MYHGKIISDDIKKEIYSLFIEELTISEIASRFNMSNYLISKIIKSEAGNKKSIVDLRLELKRDNVNHNQIQCIYGSLLGDSSLTKTLTKNNFVGFEFSSSHCNEQKEYLIHKSNILNVNPRWYIKGDNSWSPGSKYWVITYCNKLFLQQVYNNCFINERKTITRNWTDIIDWEGIAYWFMDDGCSHKYKNAKTVQVNFSTLSFTKPEIDLLREKFDSLGVATHTVKSQHGEGTVLTVDAKSVNYFMDKIKEYIVPCMKYKVKKDKKKWKV